MAAAAAMEVAAAMAEVAEAVAEVAAEEAAKARRAPLARPTLPPRTARSHLALLAW